MIVLMIENRKTGITQQYHFEQAMIKVGRAPDNDIVLDSVEVSRHHFVITAEEGSYFLTDVSRNGTVVNAQVIKGGDRCQLNGFELVRAGFFVITPHFLPTPEQQYVSEEKGRQLLVTETEPSEDEQPRYIGGTFKANPQRTGEYLAAGPRGLNELKWKIKLDIPSGGSNFSPVLDGAEIVVGGENLAGLDCLTGKPQWRYKIENLQFSLISCAEGKILARSRLINADSFLLALDRVTKKELWTVTAGKWTPSCPLLIGGLVIVGCADGRVLCLDSINGKENWHFQTEGWVWSSPAVAKGIIYVGSMDGRLYAIAAKTGQEKWRYRAKGKIFSTPAVGSGAVYFGSEDGFIHAVDVRTGQQLWQIKTSPPVLSSPALADGVVYCGAGEGLLFALDAQTGKEKWRFRAAKNISSAPSYADGVLYFGGADYHLYAVDAKIGAELWRFKTEKWINSSAAVGDGAVYFWSSDGFLYALG